MLLYNSPLPDPDVTACRPVGSILWTALGFGARAIFLIVRARRTGMPADIWRPRLVDTARFAAEAERAGVYDADAASVAGSSHAPTTGDDVDLDGKKDDEVFRREGRVM